MSKNKLTKFEFHEKIHDFIFNKIKGGDTDAMTAVLRDMANGAKLNCTLEYGSDKGVQEVIDIKISAQSAFYRMNDYELWHKCIPEWKRVVSEELKNESRYSNVTVTASVKNSDFIGLQQLLSFSGNVVHFESVRDAFTDDFLDIPWDTKNKKTVKQILDFMNELKDSDDNLMKMNFTNKSEAEKVRSVIKTWRNSCIPKIALDATSPEIIKWLEENKTLAISGRDWADSLKSSISEGDLGFIEKQVDRLGHLVNSERKKFWEDMRSWLTEEEGHILDRASLIDNKDEIQKILNTLSLNEIYQEIGIDRSKESIEGQVDTMVDSLYELSAFEGDKLKLHNELAFSVINKCLKWLPKKLIDEKINTRLNSIHNNLPRKIKFESICLNLMNCSVQKTTKTGLVL